MLIHLSERPKKIYIYCSIVGLTVSTIYFIHLLLSGYQHTFTETSYAKMSILVPVLLTCFVALFYKNVSQIDGHNRQITTYHQLFIGFFQKNYSFQEISTIHLRTEYARGQGADISRQSNTSFSTPMYILIADLKGFGKRRKRIRLNRYFDESIAEKDKSLVIDAIRSSSTN